MSFNVVVLPEPLRPRSTSVSPRLTVRLSPATSECPLMVKSTLRNSITLGFGSGAGADDCAGGLGSDWVMRFYDAFSLRPGSALRWRTLRIPAYAGMMVGRNDVLPALLEFSVSSSLRLPDRGGPASTG